MSIILMSEVGSKPSILLMKMVVITSNDHHGGQVYAQGCLKEEGLEEGGGEGDGEEQEGGEVGGHQLADKLSLQDDRHSQPILVFVVLQIPRRDFKDVHV